MPVTVRFNLETLVDDQKAFETMLRDGDHPTWHRITKQIGALLLSASQRAFREQRFGSDEWPPRYPNQKGPPFVNIAGIVSDFNRGMNAPRRRFEPRPALRDTGELLNSLRSSSAVSTGPFCVEVASRVPYAGLHQEGGKSRQPVTKQAKERLAKLLRRPKRLRGKRRSTLEGKDRDVTDRIAGLRERLGFLFGIDELETEVARRPFIGVTEELRPKIVRTVEQNLRGRPWEA